MNKINYLVFGLMIVTVGSIILSVQAEQKFNNINTNFQEMKDVFAKNQLGNQRYNCIQDFEIRESQDFEISKNLNERSECFMKIDVSEKIWLYQEHGIEPEFSSIEIKYIETILTQTNVPVFEEMLQFKSLEVEDVNVENTTNNLPTISDLKISSP